MSIVRITAYGARLGTGHTGPFECDVAAVGKVNSSELPFVVANEFICSRLAMAVGLPVPAGGIVTGVEPQFAADGLAYVSLNFYPEGERPPPVDRNELRRYQWEVAGITVFDAWIVCGDRHEQNVVLNRELGVPLTFIDFDLALIEPTLRGVPWTALVELGVEAFPASLHDLVEDPQHVRAWAERIVSLSRHTIDEVVYEAHEIGALTHEQARLTIEVLERRRHRLFEILHSDWKAGRAFPLIREWGLV